MQPYNLTKNKFIHNKIFRYGLVIFIYIGMQFSAFLLQIFNPFTVFGWLPDNLSAKEAAEYMSGQWRFFSFLIATILIIWLTYTDFFRKKQDDISAKQVFFWTIVGIFLAYAAQIVSGLILSLLLGVQEPSENTTSLIGIAQTAPLFIFVICIFAPILEEIIFRGIIFKSVAEKTNFFVGVLVSAIIFAFVHQDFTFFISYFFMGFVFAYLYHKTNRLIVPIIVHATLNTIVTMIQLIFSDLINDLQEQIQCIFMFL